MKRSLYILLIFCSMISVARDPEEEQARKHLMELVKERKEKFEQFNSAIETKSGIFGNQTKKDIRAANDVLINIVKTDNRIIFELQRLLDHKSYEKTAKTLNEISGSQKTEQYLVAIANLNRKNKELTEMNKDLSKQAERSFILFWIVLFTALAAIFVLASRLRKKRSATI